MIDYQKSWCLHLSNKEDHSSPNQIQCIEPHRGQDSQKMPLIRILVHLSTMNLMTSIKFGPIRSLSLPPSVKSLTMRTRKKSRNDQNGNGQGPRLANEAIVAVKAAIVSNELSSKLIKVMRAGRRRIGLRVTRGLKDRRVRQSIRRARAPLNCLSLESVGQQHRRLKRLREGLSHAISLRCFLLRAQTRAWPPARVRLQSLQHRRKGSISSRKTSENPQVTIATSEMSRLRKFDLQMTG